jgi:hypothetical protein
MNAADLKQPTKQFALRKIGFQPVSAGGHLARQVGRSEFAKLAAWLPSQARCLTSYNHSAISTQQSAIRT